MYEVGDRVLHPDRRDWGIAEVIRQSGNMVTVWFEEVGEKTLSLSYVKPLPVYGAHAQSEILDGKPWSTGKNATRKEDDQRQPICKNCGQPTRFSARSSAARVDRGWCEPCMRQSERKHTLKENGETVYYDEYRTIDGVRTPFSPR